MSTAPLVEIRSVLIPLARNLLLLPNVVVAEVMNYSKPVARENAPDWFIGDIAWRGSSVPVVSIDHLMGHGAAQPGHRSRMIIMNTINGEKRLPHIGIVADAIPSLVRVTAESVEASGSDADRERFVKQVLIINDQEALIPDLDELENLVVDFLISDK